MSHPHPPAFWDERYADHDAAFGEAPNDFLADQINRLGPPGRALCLAEGQGRNAVFLAGRGWDVTAVDFSKVGLDAAQRLAAERGVTIHTVAADLAVYEPGRRSWDLIVSIFAHVPPDTRRAVHRRVVDALRPGGYLLLEAYTPAQARRSTGGPGDPRLCMTADGLRREFDGLGFETLEELERDVTEGTFHTGPAEVVRLLARRPG